MPPYIYRSDSVQAALEHLPSGPYAAVDQPYLLTARYSPVGFESHDIDDKQDVDAQGLQDNLYWYEHTRTENRAGRA